MLIDALWTAALKAAGSIPSRTLPSPTPLTVLLLEVGGYVLCHKLIKMCLKQGLARYLCPETRRELAVLDLVKFIFTTGSGPKAQH